MNIIFRFGTVYQQAKKKDVEKEIIISTKYLRSDFVHSAIKWKRDETKKKNKKF